MSTPEYDNLIELAVEATQQDDLDTAQKYLDQAKEVRRKNEYQFLDLAVDLHSALCSANHTDMCGWWYAVEDGKHDWTEWTHQQYLQKANKLIEMLPDMPLSDLASFAKAIKTL